MIRDRVNKQPLASTFSIIVLLALTGCGVLQSQPQDTRPSVLLAPSVYFQLPDPKSITQALTATQLLSGQYKSQTFSIQFQVEITPGQLVLVALSPWGSPLFSATYNQQGLKTEQLLPTPGLSPEHVLADFILTFWPEEALAGAVFGQGIEWTFKKQRRVLMQTGKPLIEIEYETPDPWVGKIAFSHHLRGYQLNIENLQVDAL